MKTFLLCIQVILITCGCGIAYDRERGLAIDLSTSPCADVRQFATTSEATLTYAEDVEATGKISQAKLVDIQERMFLLQTQSDAACHFFDEGKMSPEHYSAEMKRITDAMLKIQGELPEKQ